MPDVAQHHTFGLDVRASLPPEIRDYLSETPYLFALYGPDLWFVHQPWKRRQGRGRCMHTTRTGAFLAALAGKAREGRARREIFSYLAGFLCHYALDSVTHPYIIWQTTDTWSTKRAHRDLEHALDASLLKREGFWGERHPVTDHHFPKLALPDSMAEDLNGVYESVYGWKRAHASLNRCFSGYRFLYRQMEKPSSLLTLLARVFPTFRFRSVPYARSAFLDRDVENLSHAPWHEPYAPELTSTESFPELVGKAKEEALRMITGCYDLLQQPDPEADAFARLLGNRSYLSGLPVDDPRNSAVRSLRPYQYRKGGSE